LHDIPEKPSPPLGKLWVLAGWKFWKENANETGVAFEKQTDAALASPCFPAQFA